MFTLSDEDIFSLTDHLVFLIEQSKIVAADRFRWHIICFEL